MGIRSRRKSRSVQTWLGANGHELIGCFSDDGISGTREQRPGLSEALGVVPEHVGSSGPPWRLSAVKGTSVPRRHWMKLHGNAALICLTDPDHREARSTAATAVARSRNPFGPSAVPAKDGAFMEPM